MLPKRKIAQGIISLYNKYYPPAQTRAILLRLKKNDITFTFYYYYSFFSDLRAKSVSDLEKDRFSYASLGHVMVIVFLIRVIILLLLLL